MTSSDPQCVAPTSCLLGQSPVWSASEGLLFWVDPKRAKLHRYKPKTGNTRRYDLPLKASVIALAGGEILMGGALEIGFFDIETEEYARLAALAGDPEDIRINCGGAAPDGSFWFATMDAAETQARTEWYRLAPDRSVVKLNLPPVLIPSTACFSPDSTVFYTADVTEQELLAFDVGQTGDVSNRRVFATTSAGAGYPDGSAVDAEGYLWNAEWDGGRVVRYRPDGKVDRVVRLATARPTGCCFGADDLRTLYITTARTGLTGFQMDTQPFAGSLFALRTEVPGRPSPSWRG
jgi:sugar lactone lactonase YvrE